jgi:hypothetical protein
MHWNPMAAHRNLKFVLLAGGLGLAALAAPALADNEPVIVIPGRVGVPVLMYGVDVSGAVIEGEWGLNRPGVVAPTVIMRYWGHDVYETPSAYFPTTGQQPRVGRLEVIPPPNRRLPKTAQPYSRSWETHSDPYPATIPAPYDSPPIFVTPQISQRRPAHPPVPHPLPKTP